jgi:membrane protein
MSPRWTAVARRVWKEIDEDDVFGQAAKLSYYFLLAVFPMLIFLTALLGLWAKTGSQMFDNLLEYARGMLPYAAFQLVSTTLREVRVGAGGGKLSLGILATLWAASSGMGATMEGLNRAYKTSGGRPWWKSRMMALALTLAFSAFIIAALTLVLYGGRLGEFLAGYFGFQNAFLTTWKLAQWPLALAFVLLALSLLYHYAPDRRPRAWRRAIPGSIVGAALWLSVSLLFRIYLQFFNNYTATYGSLGAVVILLLWFYLTGAAILIGGEVNSAIEKTEAPAATIEA